MSRRCRSVAILVLLWPRAASLSSCISRASVPVRQAQGGSCLVTGRSWALLGLAVALCTVTDLSWLQRSAGRQAAGSCFVGQRLAGTQTLSVSAQVVSVSLWGGMLVPIGDKPSSIADR